MASLLAIAETLALFGPEHIDALSASGMDHRTDANRAAGLDPALEASGHEMAGRIRLRQRVLPDQRRTRARRSPARCGQGR